jgi:hypothetical protein
MSTPIPASAPPAQSHLSQAARFTTLLLLFTAGAWAELRQLTALRDADVWWRLRTGLWIAQMRALPSHGLSTRAAELHWTASGWCFNLLLAAGYSLFGLAALPMTVMLARCALAMLLFVLAGGSNGRAWLRAALLAAVALWLVGPPPCGPLALSIILYGAELVLLIHARRSGRLQVLYALPVLFFLWANLGPEFVWGFLPLVLVVAAETAQTWVPVLSTGAVRLPLPRLLAVTAASAAAPLLAPYSYHLYANFFSELYSLAAFKYFPQMHALGFRQPRDFVLALFVLGAFFALGRRHDLFLSLLLLLSLPIAFRIQRDAWLALLPATAVLAMLWQPVGEETAGERNQLGSLLAPALLSLVAVLAGGLLLPPRAQLQQRVAEWFPAQAAEFVRSHALPSPLFQLTSWGGYLAFALPEYPVVMDDRIALYGETDYVQMRQLADGEVPLNSVPAFTEARTLLLPADSILAQALITQPEFRPHYRVLYRDALAVVLETQ